MKTVRTRLSAAGALVALAASSVACVVPATRYDEARSALAMEQQANRQVSQRLYEMEAKLLALQATLDKRQHEIEARDERIAQSQLDTSIASRKEQDATELVDQLRGELERVGDHLRAFAEQKQELGQALDAAEARIKRLSEVEREASERALVVRDLSLLMRDSIATGEVELDMRDGLPLLRVSSARVFDADGNVLPEAKTMLGAVARASRLHPGARVTLAERGRGDGETDEQSTLRLQRVSAELATDGLAASRVTLEVAPKADADAAASPDSAPAAAKQAPPDEKKSLPPEATLEIAIAT